MKIIFIFLHIHLLFMSSRSTQPMGTKCQPIQPHTVAQFHMKTMDLATLSCANIHLEAQLNGATV